MGLYELDGARYAAWGGYSSGERRIVQRSTLVTVSIPFCAQGSSAKRARSSLLGRCVDDVEGLATALDRTSEQDEAVVDECVHEARVLGPQILLAHLSRPVPGPSPRDPDEVQLARLVRGCRHTTPS